MMKHFRKHTKTIVWVVVLSFVIWGGYSATTLKKEGRYAGEVFGKPVSFQEYNKFYNATQLFMPLKDKADLENPDLLQNFTWQNIIYAREAKQLGFNVSDEEVRREISGILTRSGLVSPTEEQYRIWLTRTLRLSPREFEEGLREFMRIQKLLRTKMDAATDGKSESAEETQKKQATFLTWTNELNQKAKLKNYLTLPESEEDTPTKDQPSAEAGTKK